MDILADKDITAVEEAFGGLGSLRLFDGRKLRSADLGRAEVLLVRSVTRVDRHLIAGSALRFVGSATAGIDHVDSAALNEAGIRFADAAACNARAVAEHVVCCIYHYAAARVCRPQDLAIGIVGYGNVGRALSALLDSLAIHHVVNDPPLAAAGGLAAAQALASVLACDVVSLHVPLVADGAFPTVGLLDRDAVHALEPGALIINAARGGVLDESALCERLDAAAPPCAAIDCWVGEPDVAPALLRRAWFATPHLAGHSLEARLTATRMLRDALTTWSGCEQAPSAAVISAPSVPLNPTELDGSDIVDVLSAVHPLSAHSERLRGMLGMSPRRRGDHFDTVRRRFGLRREFSAYRVACATLSPDTVAELRALGFACDPARPP